jgi:hypothetical protein
MHIASLQPRPAHRLAALATLAIALTAALPAHAGLLTVDSAGRVLTVNTAAGPVSHVDTSTSGTATQSLQSVDGAPAGRASQVTTIGASSLGIQASTAVDLGLNAAGSAEVFDSFEFNVGPQGLNFHISFDSLFTASQGGFDSLLGLRLDDLTNTTSLVSMISTFDSFAGPLSFDGFLPEGSYRFSATMVVGRHVDDGNRQNLPIHLASTLDVSLELSEVNDGNPPGSVPEPATLALMSAAALAATRRRR